MGHGFKWDLWGNSAVGSDVVSQHDKYYLWKEVWRNGVSITFGATLRILVAGVTFKLVVEQEQCFFFSPF